MVNVNTYRCVWCGARGHDEPMCEQKKNGNLPNVNRLRNAICNNILKRYVYKKHFDSWKRTIGKEPKEPKTKEKPKWLSAVTNKKPDKLVYKYFWLWRAEAYSQSLDKCRGMRWADI